MVDIVSDNGLSDLEEPLGHRYFYASDAPFPKGQKVVRTDHMRVSYVSVSFTSPIEAGASAVSSRVRRLRALEHLLSFKRVLFFVHILWDYWHSSVIAKTPCQPTSGAFLVASLVKGPLRLLRSRRRRKRYVAIRLFTISLLT